MFEAMSALQVIAPATVSTASANQDLTEDRAFVVTAFPRL
jgi:hypothetical protein